MRWPCLNCFLVINRPLLDRQRSFLVRPLLVKTLLPFQTIRMLPVWLFLVTRLGARTFFAALGALGLEARRAFLAALRVARRDARLADRGLLALRAAVLTAICIDKGKV